MQFFEFKNPSENPILPLIIFNTLKGEYKQSKSCPSTPDPHFDASFINPENQHNSYDLNSSSHEVFGPATAFGTSLNCGPLKLDSLTLDSEKHASLDLFEVQPTLCFHNTLA